MMLLKIRACEIMINTPILFKETIKSSCIYLKKMEKTQIKKQLEEAEGMKVMLIGPEETLAGILPDVCANCAFGMTMLPKGTSTITKNKPLFARSLSFASKCESSNSVYTSKAKDGTPQAKTPGRTHSKAHTLISKNQCKHCKETLPKSYVLEVGKNSGKPIVCKVRVDPAQLQMELDLKKMASTLSHDTKIVLASDTTLPEILNGMSLID